MALFEPILQYYHWKQAKTFAAILLLHILLSTSVLAQSQLPPAFLTDTVEAKNWAQERNDAWVHFIFPAKNCRDCVQFEKLVLITQPFLQLAETDIVAVRTFSENPSLARVQTWLHLPDGQSILLKKRYRKSAVLIADIRKALE